MDFLTLKSTIEAGVRENTFEMDSETLGSLPISKLIKTFNHGKLVLENASIDTLENRLIVRGTHSARILGRSSMDIACEFFLINDQPQCSMGIRLPEDWIPETLKSLLDDIFRIFHCSYDISDTGVIISSVSGGDFPQNVSHMPSIPPTVQEGSIFFSSFNGSGPVFELLDKIFSGLMPLNLRSALNGEDYIPGPIEAVVRLNLPAIGPISFANTRLALQKEAISVANDISIRLGNDILLLKGGGAVEPDNTFKIFFNLVGVQKEGQPEAAAKEWVNPLGLTGLSIREFRVDIGVETRGTVFGILGEIAIGQEGDPDQIILEVGGEILNGNTPQALTASIKSGAPSNDGIALTRIIEGLSQIPIGDFPLLKEIKVKHFEVYIVLSPEGWIHPIKNVTYRGLSLSANITFFGLSIEADIAFIPERGITAKGELGQIHLGNVLSVTDETGLKGPFFQVDTTQANQEFGYLYLSCRVSLFGLSQTVYAKVEQEEFILTLDYTVRGLGQFQLKSSLKGQEDFKGSAEIVFEFPDQTIPLSVGGTQIASLDLGTRVKGIMDVHLTKQAFKLSLSANLAAFGLPDISVQLTYDNSFSDLSNLADLIYQGLMDKAEEALKSPLQNPALLLQWAKGDFIHLYRDLGHVLHDTYRRDIISAAQLLKGAQFDVTEVAKILASPSYGANSIMMALEIAGYDAREIMRALVEGLQWPPVRAIGELIASPDFDLDRKIHAILDVLKWDGETLINTLGTMTLPVIYDPTSFLGKSLLSLNWDNAQIVRKLNQLGKSFEEVARFLRADLNLNANGVGRLFNDALAINEINAAKVLMHVFGNIDAIADTLHDVWNKGINEVADILKKADFSLHDVSFGARYVGYLEDSNIEVVLSNVAKALSSAGYGLNDVADGVEFTYTLSVERLTSALVEAAFDIKDVAQYAKDTLKLDADKINQVFTQLKVDAGRIKDALKHARFPDEVINGLSVPGTNISWGDIRDRLPGWPR